MVKLVVPRAGQLARHEIEVLRRAAEYDLGIIMREDPLELLVGDPRDRARWLAERSGLDARAIWEWGVIERTSTGLLCLRDGLRPAGDEMLVAAERLATIEW